MRSLFCWTFPWQTVSTKPFWDTYQSVTVDVGINMNTEGVQNLIPWYPVHVPVPITKTRSNNFGTHAIWPIKYQFEKDLVSTSKFCGVDCLELQISQFAREETCARMCRKLPMVSMGPLEPGWKWRCMGKVDPSWCFFPHVSSSREIIKINDLPDSLWILRGDTLDLMML